MPQYHDDSANHRTAVNAMPVIEQTNIWNKIAATNRFPVDQISQQSPGRQD